MVCIQPPGIVRLKGICYGIQTTAGLLETKERIVEQYASLLCTDALTGRVSSLRGVSALLHEGNVAQVQYAPDDTQYVPLSVLVYVHHVHCVLKAINTIQT